MVTTNSPTVWQPKGSCGPKKVTPVPRTIICSLWCEVAHLPVTTFLLYFVAVPQTVHLEYGQTENLPRFGPPVMGNGAHWKFPESRCCICQICLLYVKGFIVQCRTAKNLPPEGVENGQSIRWHVLPNCGLPCQIGDCVKQWTERQTQ